VTITLRPHQERAVAAMQKHNKGQIIVPTGGCKTLKMSTDAQNIISHQQCVTIVVVCPRILLAEQLCSEFLEVIDESHKHLGHAGNTMNGESHFVVLISRSAFVNGMSMLDAHKKVYDILSAEMSQIHSLSIKLK
jgi:stress-induced morphogen